MELAEMSKLIILITEKNLLGFVSIWKPLRDFLLDPEKKGNFDFR